MEEIDWTTMSICPFDATHVVANLRLSAHVIKCQRVAFFNFFNFVILTHSIQRALFLLSLYLCSSSDFSGIKNLSREFQIIIIRLLLSPILWRRDVNRWLCLSVAPPVGIFQSPNMYSTSWKWKHDSILSMTIQLPLKRKINFIYWMHTSARNMFC